MNEPTKSPNGPLTLKQLLQNYPYAQEIGWTPEEIEFLFESKLIDGERTDELRITAESFEKILEFHRKQQD